MAKLHGRKSRKKRSKGGPIAQAIWTNLEFLGRKLDLTDVKMANLLTLDHETFLALRETRGDLPLASLLVICNRLGITLQSILDGGFSPEQLKKRSKRRGGKRS
jgi:hypothetical protein